MTLTFSRLVQSLLWKKSKEEFTMKNIGKIVLAGTAGLAGYFIGFYEMKYKTLKALMEIIVEKKEKQNL